MFAVSVGVFQEVAQNAVSLAAAPRPTKENLKDRAANQSALRAFLSFPGY
jgi:hypothetical protein